MKRVVSLVAALALAVGAFAPAAFASDAGYGQTDLIPLEDLDQETFDTYLAKFYSQDYPTYGVLDLIRDTFEGGLANASGLNDSPWSWALNLVDSASDLGTEVGLWMTGVKIDPNTGRAIYPDDYLTDYAKQQLDSQLKSTPSLPVVNTSHCKWLVLGTSAISFTTGGASFVLSSTVSPTYYAVIQNGSNTLGLFATEDSSFTVSNTGRYPFTASNNNSTNGHPYYAGSAGGYRPSFYPEFASWYTDISSLGVTYADLVNELFNENPSIPSGDWNGSGYYSEHQDGFSINLPSLPSTNWGNLSKYYYNTYGDQIYEGDVDKYYYNIANNYVPYEISYDLPYWLINGSTDILNFDYSLELPTAELSTLPSDFQGGSNFWDNSFSMLAGFGSFIVLGLSFALVGLFFKD